MIIDTHAHYDDEAFSQDRNDIINTLAAEGITAVDCGASLESSRLACSLAESFENIYALAGIHPQETEGISYSVLDELEQLASGEKTVGIGEIGLDYSYPEPQREIQKDWFIKQGELARKMKLPICIHSRDAAEDTFNIVKNNRLYENGGVIHCFSYSRELAEEYIKLGMMIGVGGVVTFKNSRKLKEVVKNIPLSKIVLETDCPYLAPVPYRGKRNSSLYLSYVANEIARIKGITAEEVIFVTAENAKRLYPKLSKNYVSKKSSICKVNE